MTRFFVLLPSFETVEAALDWVAAHGGTTAKLYRGADGLVRGVALVRSP